MTSVKADHALVQLFQQVIEVFLERIMREIRRRTRVVGAFPDGQSCLNLAAARLRYIAGTARSTKRYMNMRPLYQPQIMQTEAVA
jgi:putative transposase